MADVSADDIEEKPKRSKLPLLLGLVLALAGGGGAFYATWSGMILGDQTKNQTTKETSPDALPDIAFVEVEPFIVSLTSGTQKTHLRFRTKLEVPSRHEGDVTHLLPRVVDVLNGYLRALRPSDLEAPAALTRLRSQMLRRVQIVVGEGRVNDLLIMEFVIN